MTQTSDVNLEADLELMKSEVNEVDLELSALSNEAFKNA